MEGDCWRENNQNKEDERESEKPAQHSHFKNACWGFVATEHSCLLPVQFGVWGLENPPGVSNLQPVGHMQTRRAVNTAQRKIINLLKT